MATNDIGRVTPIWRGFYSAATTYELNDIVIDTAGSVWWHKSEEITTGVAPSSGEIWDAVIDMSIFSGLIQAAITTAQTALAAAQAALADVAADMERAETAADNAENSAAAASESAAGVGALAQAAAASAEAAAGSATGAANSASAAAGSKSDAEAYAVGKRGGEDVGSTDPTYHNNAKYYAEQAASEAEAAAQSAEDAQDVLDSIPEDYSQLSTDVSDLKTQIAYNAESQELAFTDGGYIPLSSVGSESTFTPTSYNSCSYLIAECKAGDIFDVWGEPMTASGSIGAMRTAAFYDANRICVSRVSTRPTMNGVRFVANVDGYFVCNIYTQTAHKAYKNSIRIKAAIEDNSRNLNNLILRYGEGVSVTPTVVNNIVNNTEYPYGEELANYNTHIYDVDGGDLFEITKLVIPSPSKYVIAMFYDGDNFVGFKPRPSNYDSSNKYIIIVPENANKMTLSMTGSSHYVIKKITIKNAEYNVAINNGKVSIKTNSFMFEMNKHGNNNIFDLLSVKKSDSTLIKQFSTDWQGPYVAYALDNVDGDWSSSCHTGGNHAYPNPDADHPTGTPTGRTASIHVYADGVEINEGEEAVWRDNVTVEWVNYVQAWNTMKADGTGREVIKENPKWIFKKDGTVNVSNFITALEDIMVSMYYGMQEACGWMNRGFFAPGASREIVNMSEFTSEGLGTKFAGENTVVFDDNLTLEMAFNNAIDLGTGIGINSDSMKETRLHTSVSKAYFYMMYNMPLNADENARYEGYYKFIKPTN